MEFNPLNTFIKLIIYKSLYKVIFILKTLTLILPFILKENK
jgi:hypothetical protein